jgi:DNA repair exonuclease SbcCD ATPase subunit
MAANSMPLLPNWLIFISASIGFGGIAGFTAWLLNIHTLRTVRIETKKLLTELEISIIELHRLKEECERAARTNLIPGDPNFAEISDKLRSTFDHLLHASDLKRFRFASATKDISTFLPAVIAAAIFCSLFVGVVDRNTRLQLASAGQQLEQRTKKLERVSAQLAQAQSDFNRLSRNAAASSNQQDQLLDSMEPLLMHIDRQLKQIPWQRFRLERERDKLNDTLSKLLDLQNQLKVTLPVNSSP